MYSYKLKNKPFHEIKENVNEQEVIGINEDLGKLVEMTYKIKLAVLI